jgi:hypothetical protein
MNAAALILSVMSGLEPVFVPRFDIVSREA